MQRGKCMKKIIIFIIIILVILFAIIMGINIYVKLSTKNQIIENEDYSNLKDIDCIIVLGAGIWGDKPSPMLEDRLNVAISLYQENVSSKIIMTVKRFTVIVVCKNLVNMLLSQHGKPRTYPAYTATNFSMSVGCFR